MKQIYLYLFLQFCKITSHQLKCAASAKNYDDLIFTFFFSKCFFQKGENGTKDIRFPPIFRVWKKRAKEKRVHEGLFCCCSFGTSCIQKIEILPTKKIIELCPAAYKS